MSDKNQDFQKNVSEQGGVEGQRKEVNVEDYPKAAALGQILKDVDFPADKQKIIQLMVLLIYMQYISHC
jgi:hypothetical protein